MDGEKRVYRANSLTRQERILGLIYLPVHIFVLPFLISLYAVFSPDPMGEAEINLVYYVIGMIFVLFFMRRFLRSGFDVLTDNLGRCALSLAMAAAAYFALSYLSGAIILMLGDQVSNPNNDAVTEIASQSFGTMKAISVYFAPIVEECLFRGVIFGFLRKKSRVLTYAVSIVVFGLYHVWQYVLVYGDFTMLLYALQYIPASVALCLAYDRSGSIWTGIFMHMGINALAFAVM